MLTAALAIAAVVGWGLAAFFLYRGIQVMADGIQAVADYQELAEIVNHIVPCHEQLHAENEALRSYVMRAGGVEPMES